MTHPTVADPAKWHRWFAIECNNRAWRLSEAESRSEAEDAEMLSTAHAAAYHWGQVGTPSNVARAQMLLGHVHALLGHGAQAMRFARASYDFVASSESEPWEISFAHAILANAGAAANDPAVHREHYAKAKALGEALADAEERAIFDATFHQVPVPAP